MAITPNTAIDSGAFEAKIIELQTATANVSLGTGGKITLDSGTATLSSNAATLTTWAAQVTSEALTTAAGASQAFTLTLSGVAATDLAWVTCAGGTNTRNLLSWKAVCTTNTVTVTVSNAEPTNAINGTVIFNVIVMKP
jgi:hypothetical protein